MYLHLGNDFMVNERDIIGIFDIENSSVSQITKQYLSHASKNARVISCSYEMPKSFVVCLDKDLTEAEKILDGIDKAGKAKQKADRDVAAFQAAIRYQDLMDKQAAPTFKRLAGRMLFDIWGGSFASILSNMKTAVKYGLTDSVLTMHNWQRWGYDYRLPDIWPPNPRVGNVADLQAIGKLCDDNGILWGLHDNCTDFYPDADDFSIKRTFFWQKDGAPAKGWYNKGRDAQAMWFRPDATLPFVHRNYTEMRKSETR